MPFIARRSKIAFSHFLLYLIGKNNCPICNIKNNVVFILMLLSFKIDNYPRSSYQVCQPQAVFFLSLLPILG
jgi:hypothetical protein